jgi:hypothetical protein
MCSVTTESGNTLVAKKLPDAKCRRNMYVTMGRLQNLACLIQLIQPHVNVKSGPFTFSLQHSSIVLLLRKGSQRLVQTRKLEPLVHRSCV